MDEGTFNHVPSWMPCITLAFNMHRSLIFIHDGVDWTFDEHDRWTKSWVWDGFGTRHSTRRWRHAGTMQEEGCMKNPKVILSIQNVDEPISWNNELSMGEGGRYTVEIARLWQWILRMKTPPNFFSIKSSSSSYFWDLMLKTCLYLQLRPSCNATKFLDNILLCHWYGFPRGRPVQKERQYIFYDNNRLDSS